MSRRVVSGLTFLSGAGAAVMKAVAAAGTMVLSVRPVPVRLLVLRPKKCPRARVPFERIFELISS